MAHTTDFSKFYICVPPLNVTPRYKSLGETIFNTMKENHDKIMQIQAETGESETFGQVLSKAIRTAEEMKKRGITKNDIVCLCSNNHLNTVVPFLAGLLLGAKVTALDIRLPYKDIELMMEQIRPRIIFVSSSGLEAVEKSVGEHGIKCEIVCFNRQDKYSKFSEFLKEVDEESFVPITVEDDKETAVILFSNGRVDPPKGCCLSHFAIQTVITTIAHTTPMARSQYLTIAYAPLCWISTVIFLLVDILTVNAKLIVSKYNVESFWIYVQKYKPKLVIIPAPLLMHLINVNHNIGINTPPMCIACVGTPLSETQLSHARKFFRNSIIMKGYGSTECGGCITRHFTTQAEKNISPNADSVGWLFPGTTAKLIDLGTGLPVDGPFKKGELRVKSNYQMNGYYNIDSSDCWDEEGFYKTGDILYYDKYLRFYYVDRI